MQENQIWQLSARRMVFTKGKHTMEDNKLDIPEIRQKFENWQRATRETQSAPR
jgi:hypothetical protein